ncbi:MAG: YtxH domain-containing protein [Bacteroidota bacterium]|jgi:gas vesicle protein
MKKNYVIGLLAAAAVGVIAGILLAPTKGKDLRNQIKNKSLDLANKVKSGLHNGMGKMGVGKEKETSEI